MFEKHFLLVILLATALVGPAIYFNAGWTDLGTNDNLGVGAGRFTNVPSDNRSNYDLSPRGLSRQVSTIQVASPIGGNAINPSRSAIQSPAATSFVGEMILPGDANGPNFDALPMEFVPVGQLQEIFRFDANPTWIRQRWDRVSRTAGDQGLTGLRVALVTGVNTYDLFGALTYFFDANQVPQKITFRGWTGNPDGIIDFAQRNFNFKQQPASAAGLYLAKNWSKSTGALYLQHAQVSTAANPTQQVAVLFELNNPDGPYELTTEVASIIFNSTR